MVDTGFINIINQLIVLAVQEKESNNNENLIVNEMFLLKKLNFFGKSCDYFGYNVELHFGSHVEKDREYDSVHKTAYTGFLSVGINCILLYFVYFFL